MSDENSTSLRPIGFPRPPKVFGGLSEQENIPSHPSRRPLGEINVQKTSKTSSDHPTNIQKFKHNLPSTHNQATFSIFEDSENCDPSHLHQHSRRTRPGLSAAAHNRVPSSAIAGPSSHLQAPHPPHRQQPQIPSRDLPVIPSVLRPPQPPPASALPSLPFAIHVDEEDGGGGGGSGGFPPPPPIPSVSDLAVLQLPPVQPRHPSTTEFRQQNTSISSVSTVDEDDDGMWQHVYGGEDEGTTEEEMTSSANRRPEAGSESEAGGCGLEEEAIHDGTMTVASPVHRLQAVSEPVLSVVDYTDDILQHAKSRELEYLPKFNYMEKQSDISFPMRSILVDWVVEVGEEFDVETETVHLAVNYIDRFLSYMSVQRAKLQLVGTSSMFIASKYEEIYPKELDKFVYITDDTYNKRQVLKMEKLILGVLKFSVSPPTAYFFVNHLAKMAGCTDKTTALAQFLAELTLLDGETYLGYLPSIIGAASVALARHTLGFAAWDDAMVARSGYAVADFQACLISLHGTFGKAKKMQQQSIVEKYKHARFFQVSDVEPTPIF